MHGPRTRLATRTTSPLCTPPASLCSHVCGARPPLYTPHPHPHTQYGINLAKAGLFQSGGTKLLDGGKMEGVSIPYGVEQFQCPDYRATVVPLMYSFWICFTSPLMMLFFLFVLGARKEDMLWTEIPEHKWLWAMDFEKCLDLTLIDRVEMLMAKYAHHRAVAHKPTGTVMGPWEYWSFGDYYNAARGISRFLIDRGLTRAKSVAILSYNRREWFAADLGSIYAGAIPAGIYPTDTSTQIEYVLNHSEAEFVFVENQVQLEKIRSIRNKLLHVKEIIVFDEKDGVQLQDKGIVKKSAADKANEKAAEDEAAEGGGDDDGDVIEEESEWALGFESHVHYWSDIMMKYHTDDYQNKRWKQFGKFGQRKVNGRVQRFDETPEMSTDALAKLDTESATRRSTIKPEDVICMIYTSGTTGPPKAVMITHRNVGWSVFSIGDIMHVSPEDTVVSYLPLCHIAEKVCSLYGPLVFGMNVYFCAPDALRGTLVVSLRQVGPTVFFGVPRIWEKIQEKMLANSGKQAVYFCFCIPTGAWGKRKWKNLVAWARKKGLAGAYAFQQNEPMPKNWWYANELVFQNVKVALGLQRCRLMLSAAAPLSIETAEFFMCLNIIIYEAFGMSETAGPVTFNAPKTAQSRVNWRTNSCGKSITGVELKIADDGELLIRGACTCRGYFKNPEETVNLIDEEKWIHTGDIGTIDADGFLYITDRKKHLIITAGGENIAPAPIEGSLQNIPGIGYAIVVGDMQKFLVCVMTIEMQGAAYFAYKNYNWVGDKADWKGATAWLRDENKCKFKEDVWAQIEKINENLPRVSTIKKFYLFDRDFTDQGNMCELTPTLKVKHRVVKQKYQKVIKKIYGKDYKETNAKAVGGGASAGKMKINLGTWPGNRTILSMMIMTKDGKICIDDGTGCLPSVVLPDVSTNNISNSENIKFVWTQQFCKNTEKPPEFVAERTNEDMNSYGLAITSAIAALKTIVSDGDIGAIYPKMLSDFYKQDLKSAVLCSMRVVDDEKSVDVKGNNFRWIDAKSKPEYLTLQKLGNVSKTNSETPKPGIYISYMCTASTRAGLFMLTNQNNFSNIPHVLWQEGDFSAHGAKDNDLEFIRCIRAHVRGGGKIADMKHEGVEVPKFIASMEKLMAQLAIEEDETPMEKFVEHLYDFELINLDREHKVKFLVILHPTTLSNLTIPANLKKKHHLVPMAVYEPNHFYMWHRDVYTEMQVSVLGRNREASEMNWRVQHGKGEKGDKLKHKEEKEAIRKDARRWDCMKWHMKMVHWQSTEKSASYTDILSDEAQTAMSPLEQVNEVKSNWVDEYGDWEREVISICSEADGWSSLQVEVEKSKFTAKFRMKAGTGAASSMGGSQGGSVNFKSAGGASSQWGASSASSASGVGSSASMMSSASSMQSSASSVEDEDEEKSAVSSEGEKPVERKKSMSMKDKILFDEAQKKQRRVTELTNLSNNLVAQDGDSALTQSSVQDSKNMGNTRDGSQW